MKKLAFYAVNPWKLLSILEKNMMAQPFYY